MKRLSLLVIIAAIMSVGSHAWADDEPTPTPLPFDGKPHPKVEFYPGERLEYNVKWIGIKTGEAFFETLGIVEYEGRPCYHIRGGMESSGLIGVFFNFFYGLEVYVDVASGHAVWSYEHFDAPKTGLAWQTVFQPEECQVALEGVLVREKDDKYYEFGRESFYDNQAHQNVVGLQIMRLMEVSVGKSQAMGMFSERRNAYFAINFMPQEEIKTKAGTFTCDVMKIEDSTWYFADGPWRYPVKMEAETSRGKFAMELAHVRRGERVKRDATDTTSAQTTAPTSVATSQPRTGTAPTDTTKR